MEIFSHIIQELGENSLLFKKINADIYTSEDVDHRLDCSDLIIFQVLIP